MTIDRPLQFIELSPSIDEDQKAKLLHASFKGPTLFRGALARLQKLNMEWVKTLTVFPHPVTHLIWYSIQPYMGCGPWIYKRGSSGRWMGGSKQEKSVPSATATKPSKDSKVITVTVPQDSTKRKMEKSEKSPHPKRSCRGKGSTKGSKKKLE